MSDPLGQLGRYLSKLKKEAEFAAKRYKPETSTERMLDTFDPTVPFTMEFKTFDTFSSVWMDLFFKSPGPSGCCGETFCSVCELFSGQIAVKTLTFGYIPGTLNVFDKDIRITDYEETDPSAGIVTT